MVLYLQLYGNKEPKQGQLNYLAKSQCMCDEAGQQSSSIDGM